MNLFLDYFAQSTYMVSIQVSYLKWIARSMNVMPLSSNAFVSI